MPNRAPQNPRTPNTIRRYLAGAAHIAHQRPELTTIPTPAMQIHAAAVENA